MLALRSRLFQLGPRIALQAYSKSAQLSQLLISRLTGQVVSGRFRVCDYPAIPSITKAFMIRHKAMTVQASNLTHVVIPPARLRLMSVIIAINVVTGVINPNHMTTISAILR